MRSGRFVLMTRGHMDNVEWPGVERVSHWDTSLPDAVLDRPDGYFAWAQDHVGAAGELATVLTRWTGERSKNMV